MATSKNMPLYAAVTFPAYCVSDLSVPVPEPSLPRVSTLMLPDARSMVACTSSSVILGVHIVMEAIGVGW